jgi:hypothetical protein
VEINGNMISSFRVKMTQKLSSQKWVMLLRTKEIIITFKKSLCRKIERLARQLRKDLFEIKKAHLEIFITVTERRSL